MAFVAASYWDLAAAFPTEPAFTAQLATDRRQPGGRQPRLRQPAARPSATTSPCSTRSSAQRLKDGLADRPFAVTSVETKPYTSKPKPPFITSTLQQVGGSRLRMSSRQVMSIAQGLYEDGYITYMRTDSTTLSDTAHHRGPPGDRAAVRPRVPHRRSRAPTPRSRRTRRRPTRPSVPPATPGAAPTSSASELRGDQLRLYELIWQRTLASQMPDARGNTVTVRIAATTTDDVATEWTASGRTITFPGWQAAYGYGGEDDAEEAGDDSAKLPPLTEGQAPPEPRPRGRRAHHPAAAPLHRGHAREDAGGEGHRPPVHLRVDHADDPGPRLRVEEGPGARPHHRRLRGGRAARAALQPPRRLRVHRPHGGRPRRDRRRPPAAGAVAPPVLVRQRHARREGPQGQGARGGRRRGDQHDPARRRRERRADRDPQRPLRAVPHARRGHRVDPRGPARSTSSPSTRPSRSCRRPRAASRSATIPRPACRCSPRAAASVPTCSSATPTRCRPTRSRRCRRCSRR